MFNIFKKLFGFPLKSKNTRHDYSDGEIEQTINNIASICLATFKRTELRDKLAECGWTPTCQEHSGVFAWVFISPCKNYALKVSNGKKDAYSYYASEAFTHSHNPYFPKVYWHVVNYELADNEEYRRSVTLMECLEHVKDLELPDIMRRIGRHDDKHENPSLQEAADVIAGLKDKWKGHCAIHFDVHGRNVMKRGEQLVITDPII